ncbi:MAG: DUF7507 domain-containing protein [Candidatus Wenzhouxiangella sp. M2_3B_020]
MTFNFPPFTSDNGGCTVFFDVEVVDIGTDASPAVLQSAAQVNGSCDEFTDGSANGSLAVFFQTVPGIALRKEISVDGGATWYDANSAGSAPYAEFPSGAEYRLIVENTGTADLENVTINDSTLGIVDENIGFLGFGETIVLAAGDIAALSQSQVCDGSGTFTNVADVAGTSVDDDTIVTDDDPANLVCVGLDVAKSADPLGKIGDTVNYEINLINNSDVTLQNCIADDSLLSTVFTGPLDPGSTILNPSRTAQAGDPDTLINEVTLDCDAVGPVNTVNLNAVDQAETNLFQPSVSVVKTGPALAKAGDTVTYTVELTNTSSADTPAAINCTAEDSLAGPIAIAFGTNTYDYAIPADATGSVVNTVTVNCGVDGFTNVFGDSDSWTTDLFTAGVSVDKTGPALAKAGDTVTYTVSLSNDSSANAPAVTCTANDSLAGDLGAFAFGDTSYDYAIPADAAGPIDNTVTVDCTVEGFDNAITASDSHSVELINPSVSVAKACAPDAVIVGETIEWTIDVTNTGDAEIDCLVNDATAGIVDESRLLQPGDTATLTASRTVEMDDYPLISNTASADCAITGFDNRVDGSATADCEVEIPREEVCRTPGFWGTHAGTEKRRSSDLVQIVLNSNGGSIEVCGQTIDNTNVGNVHSAVEAMCVRIQGEQQRQLARQLTAMALNCLVSGGDADCTGTSVDALFDEANAACTTNDGNLGYYIGRVDCFNNGGQYDEASGECLIDEFDPNNCQNRELDESSDIFDGVSPLPGPAGSSRACTAANGNGVKVVPAD